MLISMYSTSLNTNLLFNKGGGGGFNLITNVVNHIKYYLIEVVYVVNVSH